MFSTDDRFTTPVAITWLATMAVQTRIATTAMVDHIGMENINGITTVLVMALNSKYIIVIPDKSPKNVPTLVTMRDSTKMNSRMAELEIPMDL